MTDTELLDICSDYLISSFGLTTATGLSSLLAGQISHDRIRRYLASEKRTSVHLWTIVKPHIRAIQQPDGVLYLVTRDLTLTYDVITTRYRKRWNVEPYHKSLKQNASLERSPTHTVTTQTNYFFAALCGYIKLEMVKSSTKLNHFALKAKLYSRALQVAFETLRELQPIRLAA